jgi:hypothetical protein
VFISYLLCFDLNLLVNVNKLQAFGDMKQAERERERQAFKMSKHIGKLLYAARWLCVLKKWHLFAISFRLIDFFT